MAANVPGPQVFTVQDALVLCGLTIAEAARVATNIFDNNFDSCQDKDFDELETPLGQVFEPRAEHYERYQKGRVRQERFYDLLITERNEIFAAGR